MNYMPQSEQTKARLADERKALQDRSIRFSEQQGRSLLNGLQIEGFISGREDKRYTAAGIPVIKFQLKHLSRQASNQVAEHNLGQERQVYCDISVLCIGHELCNRVNAIQDGALIYVEGYLTRNAYKNELSWVIVEARSIRLIDESIPKNSG